MLLALPSVDSSTSFSTIVALIGVIVTLVKIIDLLYTWLKQKYIKEEKNASLTLEYDGITLKEIDNKIEKNQSVLEEHLEKETLLALSIKDVASSLKDISNSQERLVIQLVKMEERSEEHFDRLEEKSEDRYDRSEKRFNQLDDSLRAAAVRR